MSGGHKPAFPPMHDPSTHESGMTLRDYFMAHAPDQPQDWFVPTMPEECPVVPSINRIDFDPLRRAVLEYLDSDFYGDLRERVVEWVDNRDACERKQVAWQSEFRKQRYVQWPAAWADEMLKVRG